MSKYTEFQNFEEADDLAVSLYESAVEDCRSEREEDRFIAGWVNAKDMMDESHGTMSFDDFKSAIVGVVNI